MLDCIKTYLINILENQDYYRFVHLHPHIQQWKDLLIDDNNIYSADGTTLTLEQIDAIHDIAPSYSYVLVYTNELGEKQVFFNYHNGTNGEEMDAVNSLHDVYKKLSFIKKHSLIKWTTLLDYNPDHCDDVYNWFITFIFK